MPRPDVSAGKARHLHLLKRGNIANTVVLQHLWGGCRCGSCVARSCPRVTWLGAQVLPAARRSRSTSWASALLAAREAASWRATLISTSSESPRSAARRCVRKRCPYRGHRCCAVHDRGIMRAIFICWAISTAPWAVFGTAVARPSTDLAALTASSVEFPASQPGAGQPPRPAR